MFSASALATALNAQGYGSLDDGLLQAATTEVFSLRRWKWHERDVSVSLTVANDGKGDLSPITNTGENMPKLDTVRFTDSTGTDLRAEPYDVTAVESRRIKRLRHTYSTDRGYPRAWARVQAASTTQQLWVWPRPDRSYTATVTYYEIPSVPTTFVGSDVHWPREHMDVLTKKILMMLAVRHRDWAAYDRAEKAFDRALAKAIAADNDTDQQSESEVQSWSGWGRMG